MSAMFDGITEKSEKTSNLNQYESVFKDDDDTEQGAPDPAVSNLV